MNREATIKRKTKETDILLRLNLDGGAPSRVDTGIPFMDHMLDLMSAHGFLEMELKATGDREIDDHHIMEDLGITLGMALKKSLGDMRGIRRYGEATIPMDDALLLGAPQAITQVVVFTDPHCPYCSKLHQEIKKALEIRPDIAWQIKLLPFKKGSREAVETILCEKSRKKSLDLLDAAFNGRQLPPANCQNTSIDLTLKIAQEMGVRSTPALIMPNGQILPGYKELEYLLRVIDENTPASTAETSTSPTPAPR